MGILLCSKKGVFSTHTALGFIFLFSREGIDEQKLAANIRVIAEALARHVYSLSTQGAFSLFTDALVSLFVSFCPSIHVCVCVCVCVCVY